MVDLAYFHNLFCLIMISYNNRVTFFFFFFTVDCGNFNSISMLFYFDRLKYWLWNNSMKNIIHCWSLLLIVDFFFLIQRMKWVALMLSVGTCMILLGSLIYWRDYWTWSRKSYLLFTWVGIYLLFRSYVNHFNFL